MLCLRAYLIEKVLELQVLPLGITGRAAFERFRASTVDDLELAETGIRQWRVTELSMGLVNSPLLGFDSSPVPYKPLTSAAREPAPSRERWIVPSTPVAPRGWGCRPSAAP